MLIFIFRKKERKETLEAIKRHFIYEAIPVPTNKMFKNVAKRNKRWNYPNSVG